MPAKLDGLKKLTAAGGTIAVLVGVLGALLTQKDLLTPEWRGVLALVCVVCAAAVAVVYLIWQGRQDAERAKGDLLAYVRAEVRAETPAAITAYMAEELAKGAVRRKARKERETGEGVAP